MYRYTYYGNISMCLLFVCMINYIMKYIFIMEYVATMINFDEK